MKTNTDYHVVWLVLLLSIGIFFTNSGRWNEYPQGVHYWAQSDRFALSLMFLEDMNFFNPRTFVMNTVDGKVGVEFPIVPYLSAAIAKAFNVPQFLPFIFKLLNLVILFCGFSQLYFALARINGKGWSSLLLTTIWFFTPVVMFYSFNFLPDTAALGICLIGLSKYYLFLKIGERKFLFYSLLWLTLGSLIKLPVMIYLIAIILHFAIRSLATKVKMKTILLPVLVGFLGISLVFSYDYFFMIKRNKVLWSVVFMSKPNPILSLKDALSIIKGMWFWRMEYLTIPHLLLVPVVFIGSIIHTWIKKPKLTDLWLLFALIVCGFCCYFIGLGMQLANHDYYFLSSFYPAIIFFTSVALSGSHLLRHKWMNVALILLIGGTAMISIPKARERSSEVYHIRKKTIESPISWMFDGDVKLDSANLGTHSKGLIFVLYESAPNTALIYFNRKGIVFNHEEMARKHPHLEYWINRVNPSFLILQNIWEEQLKKDKPEIYKTWHIRRFNTFILLENPE